MREFTVVGPLAEGAPDSRAGWVPPRGRRLVREVSVTLCVQADVKIASGQWVDGNAGAVQAQAKSPLPQELLTGKRSRRGG